MDNLKIFQISQNSQQDFKPDKTEIKLQGNTKEYTKLTEVNLPPHRE